MSRATSSRRIAFTSSGSSASTSKASPNGVRGASSVVTQAIVGSSIRASPGSDRARSPMRRARITAPSGSRRNAASGPRGDVGRVGRCGELVGGARRVEHDRGPPDARPRDRPEPRRRLDDLAAGRDPLHLGAWRQQCAVDARSELHAGRQARPEPECEVERWRPVGGIARPPPASAAGRIEPDPVDTVQLERLRICDDDGRRRELAKVPCGDLGGLRVAFDRRHHEPRAGERHRVGADPAPEVGDPASHRRRRTVPRGASRPAPVSPAGGRRR